MNKQIINKLKELKPIFHKIIDMWYFCAMKTFIKRVIQKDMVYV